MTEIRYARNKEDQSVAYQVIGEGALDIVFIQDWVTNLEVMREEPTLARFIDRLALMGRVILIDKRGSGLSDAVAMGAIPTAEQWMDDVLVVVDDLGSKSVAVLGHGEGGPIAALFAASHPNRCTALILLDTTARRCRDKGYPMGLPRAAAESLIERALESWGNGQAYRMIAPSLAHNKVAIELRGRLERLAMSPAQFIALYPSTFEVDVRSLLGAIQVQTLVMARKDNNYIRAANGKYMADHIPDAQWVELPGDDHQFHAGDSLTMLDKVQEFLTGTKEVPDHDRVLATVLFTDIVGSTELATELGDRAWHDLRINHHELVRAELQRFRGREVDDAGDGFFATFDGPARGVRCALAIRDRVRTLGIEIRAGLHTGECELIGDKVGGIAVHIGARVAAQADPGTVSVSSTVKDLVAGSGLEFKSRGRKRLKGVEGKWELFDAS